MTLYSWSFTLSLNDPRSAHNFGWGGIIIFTIYVIVFAILATIANIQHILERAAFMQRYRQELEDKIKLTIL